MKQNDPIYEQFNYKNLFSWVKSYGCFIYSFNCIVNVFLVKTTLQRTSKPRMKKIFNRTVVFLLIFYLTIGFSGYLSFGKDVIQYKLILERPPLNGSSDIFMKIGIGMISLLTFIGYVTHVIPIK